MAVFLLLSQNLKEMVDTTFFNHTVLAHRVWSSYCLPPCRQQLETLCVLMCTSLVSSPRKAGKGKATVCSASLDNRCVPDVS